MEGPREGPRNVLRRARGIEGDGRGEALRRSSTCLRREGFTVSSVRASSPRRAGPPGLLAGNHTRVVRVFVLLDEEVDSEATRRGLAAAYRRGETRVFVRWPLRWRMLSNVARWELRGVSVSTW